MVTTAVLGDVVSKTFSDAAQVHVLIPNGADLHSAEPSARQRTQLGDADLIVAVGLGLEEGYLGAIEDAAREGVKLLELGELLDPLEHDDDEHDDDEHDDDTAHAHGPTDPHVWFDPVRMAAVPTLLVDSLLEVRDDLDADALRAGAASYASTLDDLHDDIEGLVAQVAEEQRVLVTDHDVLGYFASRYDFDIVGTVVPGLSTSAAPSARDLAALVGKIQERDVRAIFLASAGETRLSDALAREVGAAVAVVELYTEALGEPGSGAETYVGMMRTNAERIVTALEA